MARLIQAAPSTPLRARSELCLERVATNVESLLNHAMVNRPELRAKIAEAEQDRMAAGLAKLDYIPDPTVGASWIAIGDSSLSPVANGQDAVTLSIGWNLPVYRQRIEAKIKSAEARAMSSMQKYDDLRDETLREVYDEYTRLSSKLELIELLDKEIVPKANETLEVAIKAYSVSKVDIQQVLENWRKLIRLELSMSELKRDYRLSIAALEQALGSDLVTTTDCEFRRLPSVEQLSVLPDD